MTGELARADSGDALQNQMAIIAFNRAAGDVHSANLGEAVMMPRALLVWIALAFSGLGLAGCATPQMNYTPNVTQFSRPPLNAVTTVSVGDEMVSQGSTADQAGLELRTPIQVSWAYSLSAGFYPKVGSDASTNFYSFIFQGSPAAGYGVLTKNPISDPPEAVHANQDGSNVCVVTVFHLEVCNTNVRGEITTRSVSSDRAFQQTLIYNGRVGSKINIGYREFYGSTARPAFNNEVEYDLSTSDTIAYKGVKLQVVSADNTSITYRLLSNFNTTTAP